MLHFHADESFDVTSSLILPGAASCSHELFELLISLCTGDTVPVVLMQFCMHYSFTHVARSTDACFTFTCACVRAFVRLLPRINSASAKIDSVFSRARRKQKHSASCLRVGTAPCRCEREKTVFSLTRRPESIAGLPCLFRPVFHGVSVAGRLCHRYMLMKLRSTHAAGRLQLNTTHKLTVHIIK